MKTNRLLLAAFLALATVAPASADLPEPEYFPEALQYMDGLGLRDACLQVRVRKGTPSELAVVRSSGDAKFDELVLAGLRREIDVIGRFPLDKHAADASGWRTFPLQLSLKPDRKHKQRLGCGA